AAYSGDACDAPKTSATYSQLVYRAASSVSLGSDVNPSPFGQTITLTATVTPATTTGRVTFYDGGNPVGTAAVNGATGLATLHVASLLPGPRPLSASYPGDAHFAPSTSAVYDQVVIPLPSSVTLTTDPNPAGCRQTVTLTATVTPSDAAGSV